MKMNKTNYLDRNACLYSTPRFLLVVVSNSLLGVCNNASSWGTHRLRRYIKDIRVLHDMVRVKAKDISLLISKHHVEYEILKVLSAGTAFPFLPSSDIFVATSTMKYPPS
ncbi:hypothetical protein L6452_15105 [Arctium lappa]|uniref:Uncharacterized protein n=1 Tax=Arctium lappa TaxID=4217 RepID=A0ACB9CMX6_ARCLA|nr:hypothetical protein L6452_15105 [Arctium lappa]